MIFTMGKFLLLLAASAVIIFAIKKYNEAKRRPTSAVEMRQKTDKRIRLTDGQITCLSSASSGETIYAETPKFKFSQMPIGSYAYDLRTVNSLVKRGYLQSDGRGGYVKTESTDYAIRSATGF